MELKEVLRGGTDDRAVSPVIGVILMVAITVILAAVIGTFVLGLGENVQSTNPSASFGFDYAEGSTTNGDFSGSNSGDGLLTVTHESGDTLSADRISVSGSSVSSAGGDLTSAGFSSGSEVSAGDSFTLRINNEDTVRIVWTSEGGDNSATLGTFTGPDA
jgi:flagellin-like protein